MSNEKIPLRVRLIGGGLVLGTVAIVIYQFGPLCRFVGTAFIGGITAFLLVGGVHYLFRGPMFDGPLYLRRAGLHLQKVADYIDKDEEG